MMNYNEICSMSVLSNQCGSSETLTLDKSFWYYHCESSSLQFLLCFSSFALLADVRPVYNSHKCYIYLWKWKEKPSGTVKNTLGRLHWGYWMEPLGALTKRSEMLEVVAGRDVWWLKLELLPRNPYGHKW